MLLKVDTKSPDKFLSRDVDQAFDICSSTHCSSAYPTASAPSTMLHKNLSCVKPQTTTLQPLRPATARPRSRVLTPKVKAAADLGAVSTSSSCPFLAAKSVFTDASSAQIPKELAELHGPEGTWRVLPNGNTPQLPEPEGRWAWNPLLGEYGEMERKGMGPFLVDRYK